jgi:hypothetical protein
MKGPFERLKYDLRRLWECPVCKHRERTSGSVTFRHCGCQLKQLDGQPVVMKLVEDGVHRVGPPIVIEHEPLAPPALPAEPAEPPAAEPLTAEPLTAEPLAAEPLAAEPQPGADA